MSRQYNFSHEKTPSASIDLSSVLAIDTGSPVVSVAISVSTKVVAERVTEQRRSSGRLLRMIDEVVAEAGLQLSEIGLLLGLRGPGSFTGLRVGLATLQGMRLALGTPTATLPTLQVLATLAPVDASGVTGCVDALRGEWLTQEFSSGPLFTPLDEPVVRSSQQLTTGVTRHCVGFGVSRLDPGPESGASRVLVEPPPLAPQALQILDVCPPDQNPELLACPLYLRAPAATPLRLERE